MDNPTRAVSYGKVRLNQLAPSPGGPGCVVRESVNLNLPCDRFNSMSMSAISQLPGKVSMYPTFHKLFSNFFQIKRDICCDLLYNIINKKKQTLIETRATTKIEESE